MAMDFERYKRMNDEKENFRVMEDATVDYVYTNGACGDGYHIYLKLGADGRIQDASYTTSGCGFGLAALAVVTKLYAQGGQQPDPAEPQAPVPDRPGRALVDEQARGVAALGRVLRDQLLRERVVQLG